MRKGVKADSRFQFAELFFDGSFERPLSQAAAGEKAQALEMVRWAPSAVNKQPWRVVMTDRAAHFYEKKTKGYINKSGWDLQKIDMGIALCHFACGFEEQQRALRLEIADPGLPTPQETEYIASYIFD